MKKTLSRIALILVICLMATSMVAMAESEPIIMNYWVSRTVDRQVDPESETYKLFHDTILEATGVDIVLNYYDWGDTYNQKMNMYAAGQDLPSGVWIFPEPVKNTFTLSILNFMGEAGMFHDWTPYVNDVENYPTLKKNAGEAFISMTTNQETGELYIYPCNIHHEFPHAPGGWTVRKDWMEQVGAEYPTNEEEMYQLLKTFKEQIKDVNGDPVIPFALCGFDDAVEEYVMRFILNSWMGSGVWYEHDGRFDYAKYTKIDELTQALTFFNKLWNEGLMDKETFSQTPEMFIEKCVNGQIGVHGYSYVTTYTASDVLMEQSGEESYFVAMPPVSMNPELSADDVNSCEILTVPMSGCVITKEGVTDEMMAAYMKVIDFCGTYENFMLFNMGIEGEDYIITEDGRIERTESYIEKRETITNFGSVNGYGLFTAWNNNPEATALDLASTVTQKDRKESCDNLSGHQVAIDDAINAVIPGEIELSKAPLIENAWTQMVIKAISAPTADECAAIVADWPNQLNALGYEEWVAERTATYNASVAG